MRDCLSNPNLKSYEFSSFYARFRYLVLSGLNRIQHVMDQASGDLLGPSTGSFQELFKKDDVREKLSDIVYKAFGLYLTIDPTLSGHLRLRLSTEKPTPAIERSLDAAALQFHSRATHIMAASDGVKAFVGIMCEILAGDPNVLLIDEPEAFLHPSLAFQLGHEISSEISKTKKQMFVSTHSPQFVMGCLQSGVDVTIVRLTHRSGSSTARVLPSEDLKRLMRNPLLRSVNVVAALFHEAAIVTEGDADRAFYQEINERLLRDGRGRGIPGAIFLNAQNKQTIPTILSPLRSLGIPAAAVLDIDFIKDGGKEFSSALRSFGVPEGSFESLSSLRRNALTQLEGAGKNFKREGGLDLLPQAQRESTADFFETLAKYGAFVIENGELESWLKNSGIGGHGPKWLISMFEHLGDDPSHPSYVHPSNGDVWEFLDKIRAWVVNPNRRGIY